MYKRILVATDGSSLSKKAVTSAIGLAAACGAELVALKVVPRYPQAYFEGSIPLSVQDVNRVEKQWTETAQAAVDAVVKVGQGQGREQPKASRPSRTSCQTPSSLPPKNTTPT